MNRLAIIVLFGATLVTVGCGRSGGSSNAAAPVGDVSIALAQQMIDTDTTEVSDPWGEDRIGNASASSPEEAGTVDT
jgi:hypothetical protein